MISVIYCNGHEMYHKINENEGKFRTKIRACKSLMYENDRVRTVTWILFGLNCLWYNLPEYSMHRCYCTQIKLQSLLNHLASLALKDELQINYENRV